MVADETQAVDRLPMLPEGERQRVLYEWNKTEAEYPREKCIQELFEEQVEKSAEAVAVVYEDTSLSYGELNRRANRLAHYLREQGVKPGIVVALLMVRGVELLTAILAVFKAGGAYLPLDPNHPPDRQLQILEQGNVGYLIGNRRWVAELAERPKSRRLSTFSIEDLNKIEAREQNLIVKVSPEHLAYVIYTSGSTGAPKGAMIHHGGMLNHLWAKARDLGLTGSDPVAQTASQCFDISVWQFLSALTVGGSVRIYPSDAVADARKLLKLVEKDGVNILELVPAVLRVGLENQQKTDPKAEEKLGALRWLLLTGERVPPELVRDWFQRYPGTKVMNAYGPTECSDDVTHYPM